MNWTLGAIPGVCEAEQANFFTCPNGRTFFSSSIGKSFVRLSRPTSADHELVWGLIGPRRMFGKGSIYVSFNWVCIEPKSRDMYKTDRSSSGFSAPYFPLSSTRLTESSLPSTCDGCMHP